MQLMDNWRLCVIVVMALAVAAVLAGCGGGGGGGAAPAADITPPTLSIVSYTRLLSSTGGEAAIDASASDAGGIAKVEAVVTAPDNSTTTLAMAAKGAGVYGTKFNAPANSTTTAKTYKFTVYAYDNAGNSKSDGPKSFEVPSAETPPTPPPFPVVQ